MNRIIRSRFRPVRKRTGDSMLNNIASVATSYLLRIKRSVAFFKTNPSRFSIRHCFLVLAIASMSGCGSISAVKSFWTTYQAPESGPRAKIRVISTGMVRAVPESSCVDWRKPGAGVMVSAQKVYSNLNGQSLDMPKHRGGYLLPADGEIQMSELYISAKRAADAIFDGCRIRFRREDSFMSDSSLFCAGARQELRCSSCRIWSQLSDSS